MTPRLLVASRCLSGGAGGQPDLSLRRLDDGAFRTFDFTAGGFRAGDVKAGERGRDMAAIARFLGDRPGRVERIHDQIGGGWLQPAPGTLGPMLLAEQTTDGLAGLLFDNGGAFEGAPDPAARAHHAVSLEAALPALDPARGLTLVVALRLGNVASTAPAELLRFSGGASPPLALMAGRVDPSRDEVGADDLSLFGCLGLDLVPAPPSTPSVLGLSLRDGMASVLVRGTVTALPVAVPAGCAFDRLCLGSTVPGAGAGMQVDAVAVFDTALDAARLQEAAAWLGPRAVPGDRGILVLDGSSIEAGMGSSGLRNQTRLYETALPGVEIVNVAVGGATIADRLAALPGTLRLLLQAPGPHMLLCGAGANSLLGGLSPEQAYAQITAYVGLARRAMPGLRIGLVTLTPAAAALAGGFGDRFDAYNALLRANAAGADFISDRAADPVMGDPARYWPIDPVVSRDGGHPTDAGHRRLAAIDIAAMHRILAVA